MFNPSAIRRCCAIAVIASLWAAGSARADLSFEALGGPIPGGSWFQDFRVSAPVSFSNLGMSVGFGYPALEGAPSMDFTFGTSGWSQSFGPPSGAVWPIAAATGPQTSELVRRAHFADPVSQSFTLTLFAYDDLGSNVFQGATALWNGTQWSYAGLPDTHAWEDFQASAAALVVPVPSAAVLCLLGMMLVGVRRVRRSRID